MTSWRDKLPTAFGGTRDRSPTSLEIQAATKRNIRAINELYRSIQWSAPGSIGLRDVFLIAWRGRTLVGSVMYWHETRDNEYEPLAASVPYAGVDRLHIREVIVAPAAQRSGVGRALLQAAAQAAIDGRVDWLWTWPSQNGAPSEFARRMDFYAACGMTEHTPPDGPLEMVARSVDVLRATVVR